MKIAFFGTGLMGAGFVKRARANGWDVNVWNRSPAKARALEALGARAFDDPAAALVGAERIHLSLADDASVDAVLEPLAQAIPAATWIVDHTTTAVRPTAERVARWDARGRTLVHAPVFMAPSNCAEGTGLMLVSGDKARHDALLPALQAMTGKVVYLGAEAQRAAAFKLFGNLTLIGMLGVLGDVARLAHSVGISTKEAFSLFDSFNPGQTLPARAARITAADWHNPSFEVSMARKDVRLMIEEAQRGGVDLFVMPGVAAMFDAAIARGEGALDAAAAARAPGGGQAVIERQLDIATADGAMNALVVHPEEGGPFPVVLFYMDAPGKREELHDMARRIATVGYCVLLPNLYYRQRREFQLLARTEAAMAEMFGLMQSLDAATTRIDTQALLDFADALPAADATRIGAVGYCMSGPIVMWAAAAFPERLACIASIHGANMATDKPDSPHRIASRVRCESYFACAEIDRWAPPADIQALQQALQAAGTPHRIEWYPGVEHGFVFPQRAGIYNRDAAERHWERLFSLFARRLGRP